MSPLYLGLLYDMFSEIFLLLLLLHTIALREFPMSLVLANISFVSNSR